MTKSPVKRQASKCFSVSLLGLLPEPVRRLSCAASVLFSNKLFFFQDIDKFGNEITQLARPLPVEYLIIDVSTRVLPACQHWDAESSLSCTTDALDKFRSFEGSNPHWLSGARSCWAKLGSAAGSCLRVVVVPCGWAGF